MDATCDKLLVLPGDGYVSSFAGSMSEYLEIIDADDDECEIEEAAATFASADLDMESLVLATEASPAIRSAEGSP